MRTMIRPSNLALWRIGANGALCPKKRQAAWEITAGHVSAVALDRLAPLPPIAAAL